MKFQVLRIGCLVLIGVLSWSFASVAGGQSEQDSGGRRKPDFENHAYGSHPRQVFDLYRAESDGLSPVVVHIHGGGWVRGDKANVPNLKQYLDAGISVASINYRFTWQAQQAGIEPPVAWPLADAARAIQHLRSKAESWGLNPKKIAATGGSAGACSSLYLAFTDDLANPDSTDPVERQSTRLTCVAVNGAQTTLDPQQMRQWIPNSVYGGHAFGFMDPNDLSARDARFGEFLANRQQVLKWIEQYSPWHLVSSDDPPVLLQYSKPPSAAPDAPDPTHSAQFGVHLQARCQEMSVTCDLVYPGSPDNRYKDIPSFLLDHLKNPIGN